MGINGSMVDKLKFMDKNILQAKIKLRKEGSPSWMWILDIDEEWYRGEILTTLNGFMTAKDAEENAIRLVSKLNAHDWEFRDRIDATDENYNWIPYSFVCDESTGEFGYYIWLIANHPMVIEAFTYYTKTKEESIERIKKLTEHLIVIVGTENEEHEDDGGD